MRTRCLSSRGAVTDREPLPDFRCVRCWSHYCSGIVSHASSNIGMRKFTFMQASRSDEFFLLQSRILFHIFKFSWGLVAITSRITIQSSLMLKRLSCAILFTINKCDYRITVGVTISRNDTVTHALNIDDSDFQQTICYRCSRDANIGKRNETSVRNVTTVEMDVIKMEPDISPVPVQSSDTEEKKPLSEADADGSVGGASFKMASTRSSSPPPVKANKKHKTGESTTGGHMTKIAMELDPEKVTVKVPPPKFISITLDGTEKTMKDISPFYVRRALDGLVGKVRNATRLRNGSLLVETASAKQSETLLKAKLLGSYPIKVERHSSLNTTRGVVHTDSLDGLSDEEIQLELAEQSVSKAYRLIRKRTDGLNP
ncbi:hypothetical protein ANN_27881 [Periplaneta americana]|uniref:Uncharacterized protein n=1 Tax=Periplaneta americana TaxID=6978 RepID=A0ABQ8RVV4_PERAM|nr:hypothetical protein ANN_27881 [Periplaneta americana]